MNMAAKKRSFNPFVYKQEKVPRCKKSDGKTVYHAKRETERNRFASASRRDNQKCEVFKMATWMVITKSSVFDV